ncbi:MAG: hypothetical protein QOG62_248 [Thermoleophilaceae bacterium]|nr:hypothetical protein [Thermoleophilaceae bacterium]
MLPCPARRLELVLYPAAELREPSRRPAFDLNLNTGADGVDHAGLDPGAEASHWFLIDLSIARQAGRALAGPPPQRVFPELPRDWLLEAILESIEWHAGNSPGTPSAVLNACRGWNFAATGTWTSKPAAGAWAATRVDGPQRVVIEAAMEARELGSEEPVEGHSEVGLAPHIVLELRRLRDPTPG